MASQSGARSRRVGVAKGSQPNAQFLQTLPTLAAGADPAPVPHLTAALPKHSAPLAIDNVPSTDASSHPTVQSSSKKDVPYTDPQAFQSWIGCDLSSDQFGDLGHIATLAMPAASSSQLQADLRTGTLTPLPHHNNVVPFPQVSANRSHPSYQSYAMQQYERNTDDRLWYVLANFGR